jgi:hypothetical protein
MENKNLLKALSKFQQLVKPIKKDANNPFFKSSYASLDHIQEHIKPTLIECGLVVIQRNVYSDNANQLFVESKVVEVESGEWESSLFPVVVSKTDAQSYGSAVSYAKRYSLSGLLNLTIQDQDDDAQKAVEQTKQETVWLTDAQFKKALDAEPKQIKAVIAKYSQAPFAMSKDFKNQLLNKINE